MQSSQKKNMTAELLSFLLQESSDHSTINKLFTLETFGQCISDQQFSIPSKSKLKMLKSFKYLVFNQLRLLHQNNDKDKKSNIIQTQKLSYSFYEKVSTYLAILNERKLVFLPNQEQWKEFIEILLKLIFGLSYQLNLPLKIKQKLLIDSVQGLNRRNNKTKNIGLIFFVQQLQSLGLLRQLLDCCSNRENVHFLFEVCFIILVHQQNRSHENIQNDLNIVPDILDQIFMQDRFSQEYVQFYSNLLDILKNFIQLQSPSLAKLTFKMSTLKLIRKINQIKQNPGEKSQITKQIQKIKHNLKLFLTQKFQLICQIDEFSLQRPQQLKLLQISLIATFLIGENYIQNLSWVSSINVDQKFLFKVIQTLKVSDYLNDPLSLFSFCKQNLSFINQTIKKLKQNPSKGLKFIDHESSFSANISSECEINFKIKALKSKDTVVLFELTSKNKRIEIIQKIIDSKFLKIGCLQYVKNQIKSKQVQQLFDFQPTQQFSLYFQKSKAKLHLIKKVNETTQNLKLLQIQKFQSVGSKINIGMIQGIIKETKNVEEIQKFVVLSQSMKKDKTQLIEKTNIFKIAVEMLERNGQNMKNSDTKMYGFKMNNLSVKNYHNNFGLFAQKNNIKPLVMKTLKGLINAFFQIQMEFRQKTQQKVNIESEVYKDFISSVKRTVQLLKSSEEEKSFSFDDVLQTIIQCFLQKFDFVYQNNEFGSYLIKRSLDVIKIISTQASSINLPNKTQPLTIKFLTSIINCSIPIYLSSIEIFIEKFLSESYQANKHTLQLFRTIVFHAVLLISDPKVLKQEKTMIIEKAQIILVKVQENLSHRKLKYNEINQVEQTLRFMIGILKNDKYENESHQKMRRFKLSFLLSKFIKESLSILKFNAEMVQNLLVSSQNLCTTKIQHLNLLIQKDEDVSKAKNSDQTVTTSTDIKNFLSNDQIQEIQQQMCEQALILSTKSSQAKLTNQSLKDKIYLLSVYIDLFYVTKNFGHHSIQKFQSSLEEILKYVRGNESLTQSIFESQLLNKSWINFLKIFESTFDHNEPQESYLKSQKILQKLISYGFQSLSNSTVLKIFKTLLFHPALFFSNLDDQIFYERLNQLDQQILKTIQDLCKKSSKIDKIIWMNIQKSLILLFLKTQISVNSLMEFQMQNFQGISQSNFYLKALEIYINAKILRYLVSQKRQKDVEIKQLQIKLFQKNNQLIKSLKQNKVLSKSSEFPNFYHQISSFQKSLEKGLQTFSEETFLNQIVSSYKIFLENFLSNMKIQFKNSLEIKSFEIKLLREKKQKLQKVDNKKQIKGNLKKQISAKQLNLKIDNKKELIIQTGKDGEKFRSQQPRSTLSQINRKIGKNITEQKILLNHIQNLAANITIMESSLSVTSIQANNSFQDEKIYLTQESLVQFNKRSNTDFQYSVDNYCDKNGMKMMLCKKNVTKKLPKIEELSNHQQKITKNNFKNIIENLKMIRTGAQVYSIKLIQKVPQNKNFTKKIYDTIPTSPTFKVKQKQIGHYVDAFKVTLITNCIFYQGELKVYNYNLCDFVESKEIDMQNYQQLAALESEQRKKNEILKNPKSFQIKFDINGAQYIRRKYLKVDNSIQIFTKNRSYFFVFKNQKQRDSFTAKVYEKAQINHDKIHKFTKMWQKGAVTNFQYLMEVNKFADRSINDISQYYVFPWTMIDNKQKNIDDEFIKNPKNYRDLTKPIGKINEGKFAKIKSQYQNSKKYANSNRPVFLYSSFYSNPAIVSYYMIRLHPFSAHQYELQSGKFDQSDRLFGSIQGNYSAVYNIPGDFKELIPEFYYNPYFLKNLNQYDFGATQKNVIINDVELPQWVKTKTPEQFVFRMRKCLQSSFVTQNLHKWIDLTFGMCAQRTKAEKYQNLYNENVYGQNLENQNLAFINKYLKEFGEIPRIIFQTQHPANLIKTYDKRRMMKKSKSLTDMLKQQLLKQQIKQYSHNECERLKDETESNLIKFNRKNAEKQDKDKNLSKQSMASMKSIQIFGDDNDQNDQNSFMMIRQNCLIAKNAYGIGYYNFSQDNKDPFDYKNRPQISTISKCDLLTIQDSKNAESFLLSIENFKLFGHKFNSKSMRGWKNYIGDKFPIDTQQNFKLLKTIGSYLILVNQYDEAKIYTTQSSIKNKKSKSSEALTIENSTIYLVKTIKLGSYQITDIQVNEYLSFMSLKVNQKQFVVFDVRDDIQIDLRLKFSVDLMYEEKILKVEIHNMGYFLIFTNKNRFVLFNLLGEMIVNIMVCFDKQMKMSKQESITSTCFWSQQSSNLLFSTNLGILYKADLFDMAQKRSKNQNYLSNQINLPIDQFEIFKEENKDLFESFELKGQQKIVDMKMERRGRHWKVYCLGRRGNIYTLKNKYFDMAK